MKSQYGDRDTVGTQYLKAQQNHTEGLLVGDVGDSMLGGLVDDINETIASDPFEGRPFYINVVEERDLQMKNTFKRRLFKSHYRPYPEDNTLVFYAVPKNPSIHYCWDLPHHSELPNILINSFLYDHEYIQMIKQWLNNDLVNFGFIKVSMNSSQVEGYDEKIINSYRDAYVNYCKTIEMDEKAVETERKIGYFWIPNKLFKDKDMNNKNAKIALIVP